MPEEQARVVGAGHQLLVIAAVGPWGTVGGAAAARAVAEHIVSIAASGAELCVAGTWSSALLAVDRLSVSKWPASQRLQP